MQLTSPSLTTDESNFQIEMLNGVSRTFAFTIPQLPDPLSSVVSNAYLLCRILDTIEDETALDHDEKQYFCGCLLDIISRSGDPQRFADELAARLSSKTILAEHLLIRNTPRVISIKRRLTSNQQRIIDNCLATMTKGMLHYQKHLPRFGLPDLRELNRYCYFVAGTVGELLTDLFCDHSPLIARHRQRLRELANSFGQGLQFTNILKDIWGDLANGVCWLPRDVFAEAGFNLDHIDPSQPSRAFENGIRRMVRVTCGQLEKAFEYSMIIPPQEKGIRKFCLWNIGMAAYTLQKINRNPGFSTAEEVKISRRTVKFVVAASTVSIRNDWALRMMFRLWTRDLQPETIKLADPVLY